MRDDSINTTAKKNKAHKCLEVNSLLFQLQASVDEFFNQHHRIYEPMNRQKAPGSS